MALVFIVLILAGMAFIKEWMPPDMVAMFSLGAILLPGIFGLPILSTDDLTGAFSNPAPLTIACMFVMSAGLEKSGPEFGFSKLFENRYCILTPFQKDDKAIEAISGMWKSIGMKIEIMDAERHDRVLAMTSHIPQLIAYSVVGTATELESHMRDEVIKYSAAGFRDFTRLAGSDPIMWRDVYQKNKNAVLEMLGRFSEDLSTYQKAIRNGDLEFLENKFNQSKKIRKEIEDIGQAGSFDPTEKKN